MISDVKHVLILPSFYSNPEKPVMGSFFRDQAFALKKRGITVRVVFFENRSLRAWGIRKMRENHFQINLNDDNGLPTLRMHGWNPLAQTTMGALAWSYLTVRLIDSYIERFGLPDLIHAHCALWAGYAAAIIKKKHKVPYVLTEHSTGIAGNTIPNSAVNYVRKAYTDANALVSVSLGLSNAMRRYCPDEDIFVVPNVVHTDYFTLPSERRAPPPFIFLAVAHLVERKGMHVLINAFARKFQNDDNVKLEIGGDGPSRQRLENLSERLGVKEKIIFLGALSRQQVREAMWRAHCFILPSFLETFGVVLIEAMSTGIPVIATRCGGPEYFIKPEFGNLVSAGDEEALGVAMESILANYGDYSGKVIHNHINAMFGELSLADKLFEIYKIALYENI